ncbi:tetratricopeptide repeat protein [Paracoccus lutimaris]|nr:tetratricopeptide repeat protein [Paracoccus lutimaris]
MRLPVPHFHHIVAAGLILSGQGMEGAQAQTLPGAGALVWKVQSQGESQQGETDRGATGDAISGPVETPEMTAEARLREREDLDLLFAELAQPEGETWARAETDILRIWSRSGSAAMDLLYKRGETALDAGDTAGAIGHLTALTDHAPDFPAGWHLRAVAFYLNGDFGPALADLGQVLALEPRHFAALTQLGTMLEEMGDNRRALEAYRESLKIHPHQQDAADAVKRLEQETQGTDA